MATFFRLRLGYMWDCFRSHERLKAGIFIPGYTEKSAPCPLYPPSRRRLNAVFRVVLDAVDRAVDRVGFHQGEAEGRSIQAAAKDVSPAIWSSSILSLRIWSMKNWPFPNRPDTTSRRWRRN